MPKFIRVPPDSTGKRVSHAVTMHLDYNNGVEDFTIGDVVVGQTSGVVGVIGAIVASSTTAEGTLHVILRSGSPESYSIGEELRVEGVLHATVASFIPLYAQQTQIVGGNNTTNAVAVDQRGAIFTRTAEGVHQYDGFGKLETSQRTAIGEYIFDRDEGEEDISYEMVGSGDVTHDLPSSSIILSCGTDSGAMARGTTHLYHKYQAAVAQTINMSLAIGDSGKTNVLRRWGYYDDENGLFFELDGEQLYVVVRSSTSGTVQETRIPQEEWNDDRLDGSEGLFNLSRLTLNITKLNLWWIDYQWLGAGRVRFGILVNGQRITCHSTRFKEAGTSFPFMRTGTLPVRVMQENTGVVGSSSEMRTVCWTVSCEGDFNPKTRSFSVPLELPPSSVTSTSFQPLFSGRSVQTFKGQDNRVVTLPRSINGYVFTDTAISVALVKNGELTGDTWALPIGPESSVEIDGSASSVSGGRFVWGKVFGPQQETEYSLEGQFSYETGETVKRHANIEEYDTFTLVARKLRDSDPDAEVSFSVNWVEV